MSIELRTKLDVPVANWITFFSVALRFEPQFEGKAIPNIPVTYYDTGLKLPTKAARLVFDAILAQGGVERTDHGSVSTFRVMNGTSKLAANPAVMAFRPSAEDAADVAARLKAKGGSDALVLVDIDSGIVVIASSSALGLMRLAMIANVDATSIRGPT